MSSKVRQCKKIKRHFLSIKISSIVANDDHLVSLAFVLFSDEFFMIILEKEELEQWSRTRKLRSTVQFQRINHS